MTVTGKKKDSRQEQTPEKKAEYTLVYQNQKPNRVKPKKQKAPKPDPVFFVMEQRNLFESDDDTI